jgi:hypothetical protein
MALIEAIELSKAYGKGALAVTALAHLSGREFLRQNERVFQGSFASTYVLFAFLAVPALIAMLNTLAIGAAPSETYDYRGRCASRRVRHDVRHPGRAIPGQRDDRGLQRGQLPRPILLIQRLPVRTISESRSGTDAGTTEYPAHLPLLAPGCLPANW